MDVYTVQMYAILLLPACIQESPDIMDTDAADTHTA